MNCLSTETESGNAESDSRVADRKVVSFHYRLCEVDARGGHGQWLEESFGKEPLKYLHGYHNVIVGLEKAMTGKRVGDKVSITLNPEQAYGHRHPNSIRRIGVKHLHLPRGEKKLRPGMKVAVKTERGYKEVIVVKAGKFNADIDLSHPLSGKVLYYEIEVVGIRDASAEEIAHGHVHGKGGHQH
jgi:FKBP-type peptidyl-prolyl cis-trans isomerase SlyD